MPVNDVTTNRSYQKPNIANTLSDDVGRLRSALDAIDTDMASKAPSAGPTFTGVATVAAGSAAAPSLTFTGATSDTGLYSPGADQVAISTAGTGRLFVDASGRVGIGTSAPQNLLHLSTSSAADFLRIDGPSTRVYLGHNSTSCELYAQSNTGGVAPLVFYTGSAERLRITSDGKVGIGTSVPNQLLHVNQTGVVGGEYGIRVSQTSATANALKVLIDSANTTSSIMQESTVPLILGTNNTERLRIDSTGRLLVGTSTARSNLQGAGRTARIQLEAANATAITAIDAVTISAIGGSIEGGGAVCGKLSLGRYASNTLGDTTLVSPGDNIGIVQFLGADGTNFIPGATIIGGVDGTPGANDMPGRLVFSVTADGASSPTEACRINNQRELLIGTTTRTANGGVLQISNGITFPGTQSACSDPNTLDDYEEGTWTPIISGSSTAGTGTYSVQSGAYTKIGNRVIAHARITWSAHTGTGNILIAGLPFSSNATANTECAFSLWYSDLTYPASSTVTATSVPASTTIALYSVASGATFSNLALDTAAAIIISGAYLV